MSTPFAARGAIDLGALATNRKQQQAAEVAKAQAPTGVIFDVTEAEFQTRILDQSNTVPVVLDLWATWCEPCKQLSPILEKLAAEAGGSWILAKVDVDAEPRISQAFQVQSIPSVFAVVKGQVLPLFQGAYPEAQIKQVLAELLKVAAEQGVTGTFGEAAAPAAEVEAEQPIDPRFVAAFDAVEAGDWLAAEQAYREVLLQTPNDAEALAGLAMVGLYGRTESATLIEDAAQSDVDAQLALADAEALNSDWAAAFARLIATVKATTGEERNRTRTRLLELFVIADDDPAVAPARTALASALF
ncbi:MAG: tetratricopeptide repeat protein [Actinomycetota bacterium]|nr:tetratricopeptide repeat protein [Actinomycetota bacterium]